MEPRNTTLELTQHARARAQTRGIPLRIVYAIYANADRRTFVGDGRRSLMVSRRQLDRLANAISPADRERMEGVILVIDQQRKTVITVLHGDRSRGQYYRRQFYGRRYRYRPRRPHWRPWRV
jgi:hypothetical protein